MTYQANNSIDNCRLCSIFHRGKTAAYGIDVPWLSNESYAAVISFGAMVPGWTLVSPLDHSVNMQNSYADKAFWNFSSQAESFIRERYGSVCVFEHGPNISESLTGCGTGHAHMHIVPLAFSLTEEALDFDKTKTWIECEASKVVDIAGGSEYLFVSDSFEGEKTQGFICVLSESTSQFFRKVIARRLGMQDFSNYRTHPMLDIVATSSKQLTGDVAASSLLGLTS